MSEAPLELTTTVRRPRTTAIAVVTAIGVIALVLGNVFRAHIGPLGSFVMFPFYFLGPMIAAIQRRPRVMRARIAASAEGLRIDGVMMPRAKLKSAMLRHEKNKTYLVVRGEGLSRAADIEVANDEEADAICNALTLDAKSTTTELVLMRGNANARRRAVLIVFAALAAAFGAFAVAIGHHAHSVLPIAAMLTMAVAALVGIPFLVLSQNVKMIVGADGVVVREGFSRRVFHSHETIVGVHADIDAVVIDLKNGTSLRYRVGTQKRNKKGEEERKTVAESIVWRIQKSREAYTQLAGDAPQGALVLDRGERTLAEWLDQLRAVGAGATATFRGVHLTREQLLRIVESTTALAKERLAAIVALKSALTEDEKPRIRVAAERCALPALRERMVRVIDSANDEALTLALEEAEADAAKESQARRA